MTAADPGKQEAHLEHSAEKLKQTSARVEDSSHKLTASTEKIKDSASRTTELAADRTILAAERTYAAWVRTGLAALASGIGAKKLLSGVVPEWMVISTGTLLVLFSAFCFVVGVWRELVPHTIGPDPDVKRVPPFLFVLANGFLTLVAFAALVSIWFGRTGGT